MDEGTPVHDPDLEDEASAIVLNRRQRDVAVVGWCSFLAAAAGTMFFFAFVDPLALAEITEPPLDVDRMTGYAIGFFFFWVLSAVAAALTVYMIRTRHGHPPAPDSEWP
jgi:cytosine/uracil/thiamine/allantoin permease